MMEQLDVERIPEELSGERSFTRLVEDLNRAEERADKEGWIDADDLERELVV